MVEEVGVAVLRLKGMVGEGSALAAQLASARHRRLTCVDRHLRRQLPMLPTADLDRLPTTSLELALLDSETASNCTSSTIAESSSLESCPTLRSDAFRQPTTSTTSGLSARRHSSNLSRDTNTRRPGLLPAETMAHETHTDCPPGDVEPNQLGSGQGLLTETARNLVVNEDQSSETSHSSTEKTTISAVNNGLEQCHSMSVGPTSYCPAVSHLLNVFVQTQTSLFKRFVDLLDKVRGIARRSLNHARNRWTRPSHRLTWTRSHIVALILIAIVVFCIVFMCYCYYEKSCGSSCERTVARTRSCWFVSEWTNIGLQFHRHAAPPAV